jgi:hypothetical protein
MREQLGWLAAIAEAGFTDGLPAAPAPAGPRSPVSLRVLPFTAGAHAAAGSGPMTLLRFAETPDIGVVHLSALSGGVSLAGRDVMTRYLRAFAQLRAASLTSSRSAQLIRAVARGFDR